MAVRTATSRFGHHWARRGLVGLALALVAGALPTCSFVVPEAQGASAWSPFGSAVAVASSPAGFSVPDEAPQAESPPLPPAPRVAAPSVVLADLDSGAILYAKRPDDRRPIASL